QPSLDRHDQRPIGQLDALLRRWGEKPPGFIFQFSRQVFGLTPGPAVIPRPNHHKLGAFSNLITGLRTVGYPLMVTALAVHPNREDKDLARLPIDNDARI